MLLAALASGLMIGIERGWRMRFQQDGSRVAGIRTYALLGATGGLAALLAELIHPAFALIIGGAAAAGVSIGFWRDAARRDATGFVAALLALGLGMLAGAGQPALAVAGGAVVTLILATRPQSHGFVARLNERDLRAFARYLVIAAAVLPFLPNRFMGPLDAWNPFQLWIVVILVTGFSFAGYVANRIVGVRKGTMVTAIIGGAYSSTAVTASLSQRIGKGEEGPLAAGVIIASAVMYFRVILLVAVLSPSTLPQFLLSVGPAALAGMVVAVISWARSQTATVSSQDSLPGNPIDLLPAFGFVAIVAAAAVLARWAQAEFGEQGIATSLLIAGSFDVDAAVVTLSMLSPDAIDRGLAATALGGTIVANMLLKIIVVGAYARGRGKTALIGLAFSTLILVGTIVLRLI
jgi:uncharacterized membrane protein (DUF4010 family)